MKEHPPVEYFYSYKDDDGEWVYLDDNISRGLDNAETWFINRIYPSLNKRFKGRPIAISRNGKILRVIEPDKLQETKKMNKKTRSLKEALLDETASKKTKKRALKEQQVQYPQQMSDFAPVLQKPLSLDQIVDRYIVRYERESIPMEGQGLPQPIDEAAELQNLISFLLSEQAPPPSPPDEEEKDPNDPATTDPGAPAPDAAAPPGGGADPTAAPGAPPDAAPPDENMGGSAPPPGAPPVMNTPQININNFCRSIARLLNNFDVLLNPRTIINNRVEAYIRSNYDERTSKYYIQVMDRNYSIKSTSSDYTENDSDSTPKPYSGLPGTGNLGE